MLDTSIDLKDLNAMSKGTMVEHLGILITEVNEKSIVGTMPVDHRTVQVMGKLHGGASLSLLETLGSIGSWLIVNRDTHDIVGTEINGNHLKMADSGLVTCKAHIIHCGRKMHVWQGDILNEKGDLVCTGRLTTMVIEKRK